MNYAVNYTDEQIALIKRTIAKGASNDELSLFLGQCKRTGLDPFSRQICLVRRKERKDDGSWGDTMSIQVTVDGLRLVAERTERYKGQTAPVWCGPDGKWVDVWLSSKPPAAARVGVYREGFAEPVYGVATWASFAQVNKEGLPLALWRKMPDIMLLKCAESQALRKAFPMELSGLYSEDEMPQAEPEAVAAIRKAPPLPELPQYKKEPAPDRVQEAEPEDVEADAVEELLGPSFNRQERWAALLGEAERNGWLPEDISKIRLKFGDFNAESEPRYAAIFMQQAAKVKAVAAAARKGEG